MPSSTDTDLGFRYQTRKTGEVVVSHHGRLAATLRAGAAREFLDEVQGLDETGAQQLMARLTGNYKRGNESLAAQHPRNRR